MQQCCALRWGLLQAPMWGSVSIDRELIGRLIGPKGSSIQALEASTGARLAIFDDAGSVQARKHSTPNNLAMHCCRTIRACISTLAQSTPLNARVADPKTDADRCSRLPRSNTKPQSRRCWQSAAATSSCVLHLLPTKHCPLEGALVSCMATSLKLKRMVACSCLINDGKMRRVTGTDPQRL